ncbi:DUF1993 family protein [Shewanella algae]|uniref:DUF1993 family protein n=1 Tax=Shewanella algae TaxID=38313 RepID=UPI001AB009AD|nr:DUF1993 family protein [Shewanella algae]MBO2662839.1 DUF1993 family protein [Shewanella algae]MCL1053618.1 DUF1993 domain-containing protein [Shewanella algae]
MTMFSGTCLISGLVRCKRQDWHIFCPLSHPHVESLDKALEHINNTKQLLLAAQCDDSKMLEVTRIELDQGSYIDLPGTLYINDFLIPNFYFHMVTAYDILRHKGLDISKPDYMLHLASLVKQA